MTGKWACVDGNEATARVAHALSEVIALYPITPASPMGELCDVWSAAGRANLWGTVPEVIEMQSEAGAAGALHGAAMKGALATTFTASQGLLLMLPNMFKLAGELTPAVIHVAARTIATHALSIFGDHSDVMAARTTGWVMLASSSVQEAHDFAAIAHAATLQTRVPFLHFFDGFRTSHQIDKIQLLTSEDLADLVDIAGLFAHRNRGLSPDRPVLRGSAQNPDVFFQAREAINPFYDAIPATVQETMDRLATRTGRAYNLVDYIGSPDAERVLVVMGSAAGAAEETVEALVNAGERVGVLKVRLFRPFPADAFLSALPESVRAVGVLDRTKEPGAPGEPLLADVAMTMMDSGRPVPVITGGRYGLASKEVTPAMLKAALDELAGPAPKRRFTLGIVDDVTHMSLLPDEDFTTEGPGVRAVFYGLGSDGTVGATKASVKIIGENTDLFAQGYFVYDSKKSGAITVSHLRFGPEPIRSTYLIGAADFVACHQAQFLDHLDVLRLARPGATFLLNSPHGPGEVWDHLPVEVQQTILDKGLSLWVVDAYRIADKLGLRRRINTVMQACFFHLAGVLPPDEAIAHIKSSIERAYAKRGHAVVDQNFAAVDAAVDGLHQVDLTPVVTADRRRRLLVPATAPEFVQRVTGQILAGEGDRLPVSAMPVDGTFPTGTARWEKRQIATEIPIWDPEICIDCAKCTIVCPHAAIRMNIFEPGALDGGPDAFPSKDFKSRELPGHRLTIQVAPDDCTGCGVCVQVCPAHSKTEAKHKAINMAPAGEHRDRERANFEFFTEIPELDRSLLAHDSVKGSQVLLPLFEFSGACAGCGETPYLKLLSQLFGDRAIIANATGCSSIYGGNLPTTPWSTNREGRGPAWANSLFEDNAEFGIGIRLGLDAQHAAARGLLDRLAPEVGAELAAAILAADQSTEVGIVAQRERVAQLSDRLAGLGPEPGPDVEALMALADELVRRSMWIVGGDGWAYDIGAGGLDHVLGSGRDVNILVLDTEGYANTGGQASKATFRGAVAKFAAAGKSTPKKDLGAVGTAYGNVYVAQVALGANDMQTVRAFTEAEAWPGPSLIIAYSTCIPAHGFEESQSMAHQRDAVRSGYWPLYRYHPGADEHEHPFQLDSRDPAMPVREFALTEARFAMLARSNPERADDLLDLAQRDVDERWRYYQQLAGLERTAPTAAPPTAAPPTETGP